MGGLVPDGHELLLHLLDWTSILLHLPPILKLEVAENNAVDRGW